MFWDVHVLGLAPDLFLLLCLYFIFQPMKDISLLSQKLVTNLKLRLQYPIFMAFIVAACIDQSLGITSWAVANLYFRLQHQLGSWGTHQLTLCDSKGWPTEGHAKNLIQLQTPLVLIYQLVGKEEELVKLIRFFAWPSRSHPWVHLVTRKILVTCKTNKWQNLQSPSTWLY